MACPAISRPVLLVRVSLARMREEVNASSARMSLVYQDAVLIDQAPKINASATYSSSSADKQNN